MRQVLHVAAQLVAIKRELAEFLVLGRQRIII